MKLCIIWLILPCAEHVFVCIANLLQDDHQGWKSYLLMSGLRWLNLPWAKFLERSNIADLTWHYHWSPTVPHVLLTDYTIWKRVFVMYCRVRQPKSSDLTLPLRPLRDSVARCCCQRSSQIEWMMLNKHPSGGAETPPIIREHYDLRTWCTQNTMFQRTWRSAHTAQKKRILREHDDVRIPYTRHEVSENMTICAYTGDSSTEDLAYTEDPTREIVQIYCFEITISNIVELFEKNVNKASWSLEGPHMTQTRHHGHVLNDKCDLEWSSLRRPFGCLYLW